jgi:serine/threonine-protein kinase
MLGSPLYMSPEQLRSSKSVDHRADIWAIGVIMFELLTGELPFGGENLGELFAAILENDAPSIRLKSPEVPEGLERIVLKCLQRRPEHRYDNVTQIIADLAPFEGAGAGLMATAYLAPPHGFGPPQGAPQGPSFGAITPNPPLQQPPGPQTGPGIPPYGAVTPSGLARPAQGGTVAMGRGTNGGWQSTGSDQLPKSKGPILFLAGAAVLLFIGAIAIGAVIVGKNRGTTTATTPPPTSTISVEPPPQPPPQPPVTAVSAEPPTTPPSATTAATAAPIGVGHTKPPTVHHTTPKPPDPPAPPVVKPPDPPAKPVVTTKPSTTTPPSGAGVQNVR